ncbi:hypothetical protein Hanom_Chr00s000003g01605761 [Helianthus anomalus]
MERAQHSYGGQNPPINRYQMVTVVTLQSPPLLLLPFFLSFFSEEKTPKKKQKHHNVKMVTVVVVRRYWPSGHCPSLSLLHLTCNQPDSTR